MIKNKIVIYDKTNRIGEYEFDPYDVDTISNADTLVQKKLNEYFVETNAKELHVMRYNEEGECTIKTISNNVEYKQAFVFGMNDISKNSNCTIAVFDTLNVAKSKMIDWFVFNHDEFEQDEVTEIVEELISTNEYAIDNSNYHFEKVIVNKC